MTLNESTVEYAALEWFEQLDYAVGHGTDFAPGEPGSERNSFAEVVLPGRLRVAIARLNPTIPEEAREERGQQVRRDPEGGCWHEGQGGKAPSGRDHRRSQEAGDRGLQPASEHGAEEDGLQAAQASQERRGGSEASVLGGQEVHEGHG